MKDELKTNRIFKDLTFCWVLRFGGRHSRSKCSPGHGQRKGGSIGERKHSQHFREPKLKTTVVGHIQQNFSLNERYAIVLQIKIHLKYSTRANGQVGTRRQLYRNLVYLMLVCCCGSADFKAQFQSPLSIQPPRDGRNMDITPRWENRRSPYMEVCCL